MLPKEKKNCNANKWDGNQLTLSMLAIYYRKIEGVENLDKMVSMKDNLEIDWYEGNLNKKFTGNWVENIK